MNKELLDYFNAVEKVEKLKADLHRAEQEKMALWILVPEGTHNILIKIDGKTYFFNGTFNEVRNGA